MIYRHLPAIMTFLLTLSVSHDVFGLATEHIGPQSKTTSQSDWAHGLVEFPRDSSRVYSRWVNGNETFYFNAEQQQVTRLITLFSQVELRDHVVKLTSGKPEAGTFKGIAIDYNVSLNVLGGIALSYVRMQKGSAETHEPILTIYVDNAQDRAELEQFEWPDNLIIANDVPDWEIKGKTEQAMRQLMHAAVNFDDGTPAADFEHGMSTTVTLWEDGRQHGFDLGNVSHKGQFSAAFSNREIARLKKGEMWLTMTVGNQLTKATTEDPRLNIDDFRRDPDSVQPVTVFKPEFYHGRILFDDDSPPIMKPLPWPEARIQITFPYVGMVRPDAKGYFKVTLTAQQFEELKSRKARRNIYVPRYEKRNRSTALYAFPVEKLTMNIDEVSAFKFPRPTPPKTE